RTPRGCKFDATCAGAVPGPRASRGGAGPCLPSGLLLPWAARRAPPVDLAQPRRHAVAAPGPTAVAPSRQRALNPTARTLRCPRPLERRHGCAAAGLPRAAPVRPIACSALAARLGSAACARHTRPCLLHLTGGGVATVHGKACAACSPSMTNGALCGSETIAIRVKGAQFPPEVIRMGSRWLGAYPLRTRQGDARMEERGLRHQRVSCLAVCAHR